MHSFGHLATGLPRRTCVACNYNVSHTEAGQCPSLESFESVGGILECGLVAFRAHRRIATTARQQASSRRALMQTQRCQKLHLSHAHIAMPFTLDNISFHTSLTLALLSTRGPIPAPPSRLIPRATAADRRLKTNINTGILLPGRPG